MFYNNEQKEQFKKLTEDLNEFKTIGSFRLEEMCINGIATMIGQAILNARNEGKDWNEITKTLECSNLTLSQIQRNENYHETVKVHLRDIDLNESHLTLANANDVTAWYGIELTDAKVIIYSLILERIGL